MTTMALEIALDAVNGAGSRTLESMRIRVASHDGQFSLMGKEIQLVNHAVNTPQL